MYRGAVHYLIRIQTINSTACTQMFNGQIIMDINTYSTPHVLVANLVLNWIITSHTFTTVITSDTLMSALAMVPVPNNRITQ